MNINKRGTTAFRDRAAVTDMVVLPSTATVDHAGDRESSSASL